MDHVTPSAWSASGTDGAVLVEEHDRLPPLLRREMGGAVLVEEHDRLPIVEEHDRRREMGGSVLPGGDALPARGEISPLVGTRAASGGSFVEVHPLPSSSGSQPSLVAPGSDGPSEPGAREGWDHGDSDGGVEEQEGGGPRYAQRASFTSGGDVVSDLQVRRFLTHDEESEGGDAKGKKKEEKGKKHEEEDEEEEEEEKGGGKGKGKGDEEEEDEEEEEKGGGKGKGGKGKRDEEEEEEEEEEKKKGKKEGKKEDKKESKKKEKKIVNNRLLSVSVEREDPEKKEKAKREKKIEKEEKKQEKREAREDKQKTREEKKEDKKERGEKKSKKHTSATNDAMVGPGEAGGSGRSETNAEDLCYKSKAADKMASAGGGSGIAGPNRRVLQLQKWTAPAFCEVAYVDSPGGDVTVEAGVKKVSKTSRRCGKKFSHTYEDINMRHSSAHSRN